MVHIHMHKFTYIFIYIGMYILHVSCIYISIVTLYTTCIMYTQFHISMVPCIEVQLYIQLVSCTCVYTVPRLHGFAYYYLYHEGGVGYGLFTMRETHIPRGRRARGMWVSLMVYRPYGIHGGGIWDPRKGYMGSYTPSNRGFWFAENMGHGPADMVRIFTDHSPK